MRQKVLPFRQFPQGFTILEILIVIAVVGILAAVAVGSYGSAQQRAYDVAVLSDISQMDGALAHYGLRNDIKDYSSIIADDSSGASSEAQAMKAYEKTLDFKITKGDIVDVKATNDAKEYCIRAYNPKSRIYNNAFNAKSFSSRTVSFSSDGTACEYTTPPTVYSGGAIPGAYETIYTIPGTYTYVWPDQDVGGNAASSVKIEAVAIAAGGKGASACGGSGGGVSTGIFTRASNPASLSIVVGAPVNGTGAQAGSSSVGPVVATGGHNGTDNCAPSPAGGSGSTIGGVSQKYGLGGNGGLGGYYLLGVLQISGIDSLTGGGGAGSRAVSSGGNGGNGTYGGGGGGGGGPGMFGCLGFGIGGNPGGSSGNPCSGVSKGNGGAAGPGSGGGGASDANGAVGGSGGNGVVRVLTCFEQTCNPEVTPLP